VFDEDQHDHTDGGEHTAEREEDGARGHTDLTARVVNIDRVAAG
jgi:hypothetical protein